MHGMGNVRISAGVLVACLMLLSAACSENSTRTRPGHRNGFRLESIGSFRAPVAAVAIPGGSDLAIAEQDGTIVAVHGASRRTILDFSDRISSGGEQGLLGLAFNREGTRLYVNYTDRDGDTRVVEVAMPREGEEPVTSPGRELLRVAQPYANHNGGMIAFAPDGSLYVGMGDGGSAGDPNGNAQDPESQLGKLLSIDVTSGQVTTVARGLRNPWRFSFDSITRSIWIGDVGQDSWEEIDALPLQQLHGANFGWNVWEGHARYDNKRRVTTAGVVPPIVDYSHKEGCSVTGGYVYRGRDVPSLVGKYVFADYCSDWIASLHASGAIDQSRSERPTLVHHQGVRGITSFGVDADGELLVCARDPDRVYRIVPA